MLRAVSYLFQCTVVWHGQPNTLFTMQLSGILIAIFAYLSIAVEASSIALSQDQTDTSSAQTGAFEPVSPPPKTVGGRSSDDSLSMSGLHERDSKPVSAPLSSNREEFGMSGQLERRFDPVSPPPKVISTEDQDASAMESRADGFVKIVPPPKVAQDHPLVNPRGIDIEARKDGFVKIVPPPKVAQDHPLASTSELNAEGGAAEIATPQPATKLFGRANLWTSGFIGNVMNRATSQSSSSTPQSYGSPSGLTSYQQNGLSQYGTSQMSTLPKYYGSGSNQQVPWGGVTTTNANPYKSCPKDGATRSYDLTIAECDVLPDGVRTKRAICINGQFPGPLIEANYGDTLQVKVTNKLVGEGTSMHWHGFLMTKQNHMDGVPGVTQCPIAPGTSMTYTFKAELYGSTW